MRTHTILIFEDIRGHNFDKWTFLNWNVHTPIHVPVLTPRHCTGLRPLTDTHKVGLSVSSRAVICVTSAAAPSLPPHYHSCMHMPNSPLLFSNSTIITNYSRLWNLMPLCDATLCFPFSPFFPPFPPPSFSLPLFTLLPFPFSPCAWRSMIICLYNDYNEFYFLFLVMRDAIAALMLLDPSETGGSLGGNTWWYHPMCTYFIC